MFETLQKYLNGDEKTKFNEESGSKEKNRQIKRNFQGATINRLTQNWVTQPLAINQSLRGSLLRLRERSRDAFRNDGFAKKYISLVRSNLIGAKGMTFQINSSGDTRLEQLAGEIEEKFKLWSKKENCSQTGKLSWRKAQRLFATLLARDGEVLIRKVFDSSNVFGFCLKFYDVSWLDENFYGTASNGNQIVMGVEVDRTDKPVAYHFTPPMGDWTIRNRQKVRVPAEEVVHAFLLFEDETQARGIPWLHASLNRLNMLDGYEEAELIGRRIAASNMGFFTPPFDKEDFEFGEEEVVDLIDEVEPGMLKELPPGYSFTEFNPKQADSTSEGFKDGILGGVAAGAEVAKHSLTGDMSQVNYSSARVAMIDERDFWTTVQQDIIEDFCEPIFNEWLKSAMLTNQIQMTATEYYKILSSIKWFTRGWSWVDPEKEIRADVEGIKNGLKTATEVLAEQGKDLEEFLKERQKESALFAKYNVPYPGGIPPAGEKTSDDLRNYGALENNLLRKK